VLGAAVLVAVVIGAILSLKSGPSAAGSSPLSTAPIATTASTPATRSTDPTPSASVALPDTTPEAGAQTGTVPVEPGTSQTTAKDSGAIKQPAVNRPDAGATQIRIRGPMETTL
jgi:hypothetical protein